MQKKQKNVNEELFTSSSYILAFYETVNLITHEFSNYLNLLTVYEAKKEYLTEIDKDIIIQASNNLRYYATQAKIRYTTIIETANVKDVEETKKNLDLYYNNFKNMLIINRNEIENYVTLLHLLLSNSIMKKLLKSSQDVINEVFKNE